LAWSLDQPRGSPTNAQKNELKPHLSRQWVVPPEQSALFVAKMEDVLAVYRRPYAPENLFIGDSSSGNSSEGLAAIHACLEASGGYEQPIARWLYRQGAAVSVTGPSRTSAYADSQLRRSKTDAVDARILARFCQREEPASWQPPAPDQEALREMSRGLEGLKKERDRLRNQLDHAGHDAVTNALGAVIDRVCEQIDALERRINEHTRACKAG
jgi:transposase